MKKTPELLEFVKKLAKQWLKSKKIAERVKEELGIELSDRTIRLRLKQCINEEIKKVRKLREEIENKEPFEIEWDNVVFYYKEGDVTKKISIPIKEIRQIREDYTMHGWNLTQKEIMVKYELTPKAWYLIKNRLGLYKTSDLIPEWLLEKIEKEQGQKAVEKEIEEVSYKAVYNKYNNMIVKKYRNQKENEYKKAITRLYEIENFLELLRDFIDNYEPKKIQFNKVKSFNKDKVYVAISDVHLGKECAKEVEERIKRITEDLIQREEKEVIIFVLGDIVENLVIGGMHKWQVEHMDGPYNFDLIMHTTNIFEEMLIKIRKSWKKVSLIGQTWNHDRLSENDYIDYTGGLVIYELIRRGLQATDIEVEYIREVWGTYSKDNDLHFILQHWHLWGIKKKTKDILREFGDNRKYNIILQWHIHVGLLEDSSNNATRVIVPALAGSSYYDKALGLSFYPWYVLIKKNRFNFPNVTFIRLP